MIVNILNDETLLQKIDLEVIFLTDSQFCVYELMSTKYTNRILLLYPYEFRDEKILKDNISKMRPKIREYIKESEMYQECIDAISDTIWDSQKLFLQNEADEHQRRADQLAEQMNEGISPYHWFVSGKFKGYIGNCYYNVDNVVCFERID